MSFLGWQGSGAGWLAAAAALLVAVIGRWSARRWRWGLPAVCAGACVVGWALLRPGGWREVFWPKGVLDHVLLPAAVLVVAGLLEGRVRTRWLGLGFALFAAFWLAGAGVARPEFWRVAFGALGVAGVLHWARACEASRALAVALCMLGGLVVGGAGWLWVGVALVLVMAVLAMAGASTRVVSPVLLMVGIVAGELGAGRMVRGGLGVVDLTLMGALMAPVALGWSERMVGRRFKRVSSVAGPVGAALGVVAVAWVAYRVLRSYT